jgi:transcription initiation factor TFIIH subunit 2
MGLSSAMKDGMQFGGHKGVGRRAEKDGEAYRRGLARHVVVVVDSSASTEQTDLLPSRLLFVARELRAWLEALMLECPLSCVGIFATCNGTCSRLCPLSSSLPTLYSALDALPDPSGVPSIQHSLDMAVAELRYSPAHCTREVLFIVSSLSTSDPGSVYSSIATAVEERLVLNVVHLAAEVHVLKELAKRSGGTHATALDGPHFHALLEAHVPPPPLLVSQKTVTTLITMGFPRGDACPRCANAPISVPGQCPVCALPLARASHLARSYHHLLPVQPYEVAEQAPSGTKCGGCNWPIGGGASVAQCPKCHGYFCLECDKYVHSRLHVCPSCPQDESSQ